MSGSINRIQLLGHLGKDPKISTFPNGGRAAEFSVATNESWTDKQTGERKESTEWHRVVVYHEAKIAFIERYFRKGMRVLIEGSSRTREWIDDAKQRRWITEVVVRQRGEAILLDRRPEGSSGGREAVPDDGRGEGDNFRRDEQRGGRRPENRSAPQGGYGAQPGGYGNQGGYGGARGGGGGNSPQGGWPDDGDGLPF
jgi:single-strand DNA-binding protein